MNLVTSSENCCPYVSHNQNNKTERRVISIFFITGLFSFVNISNVQVAISKMSPVNGEPLVRPYGYNGFGLGEGGEIEVQMFMLAQMLIRIPMLKFSTKAPLLPNPC